jgi:hypothetical protein
MPASHISIDINVLLIINGSSRRAIGDPNIHDAAGIQGGKEFLHPPYGQESPLGLRS